MATVDTIPSSLNRGEATHHVGNPSSEQTKKLLPGEESWEDLEGEK